MKVVQQMCSVLFFTNFFARFRVPRSLGSRLSLSLRRPLPRAVGADVVSVALLGMMLLAPDCLSRAHAITLDTFGEAPEDGVQLSSNIPGTTRSQHFPSPNGIGGGRSLSVIKIGSTFGSTEIGIYSSFLGYTQGAHAGIGTVTWDGDTNHQTLNPVGLGEIDLREDGGSAFVMNLLFFDSPLANQPIELALRLYDGRFGGGSRFAEVTITINQGWAGPDSFPLVIPFTLFETPGAGSIGAPNGLTFPTTTVFGDAEPPSLRHVGAVRLAFNPRILSTPALDVTLGSLTTNGRCTAIPSIGGTVVDECGVCLDDPAANQGKDRCNVCLAGPPGYSYAANKAFDGCDLCPGETSYSFPAGVKDECGTCLNGPAPFNYEDLRDVCGVCNGTATDPATCQDNSTCVTAQPTTQIRSFERRLLEKATTLRARFLGDLNRWKRKKCGVGFGPLERRVQRSFDKIVRQGRSIFTQGIRVCGGSCVTVSYANEVAALTPEFKMLEEMTSRGARMVQRCYQRRGITSAGSSSGQTTRQTIAEVRKGLSVLINECKSSRVCRP